MVTARLRRLSRYFADGGDGASAQLIAEGAQSLERWEKETGGLPPELVAKCIELARWLWFEDAAPPLPDSVMDDWDDPELDALAAYRLVTE